MWSACGPHRRLLLPPSQAGLRGQRVFSLWSACGRRVVGVWSACGPHRRLLLPPSQAGLRAVHDLGPEIRRAMSGNLEEDDFTVNESTEIEEPMHRVTVWLPPACLPCPRDPTRPPTLGRHRVEHASARSTAVTLTHVFSFLTTSIVRLCASSTLYSFYLSLQPVQSSHCCMYTIC